MQATNSRLSKLGSSNREEPCMCTPKRCGKGSYLFQVREKSKGNKFYRENSLSKKKKIEGVWAKKESVAQ